MPPVCTDVFALVVIPALLLLAAGRLRELGLCRDLFCALGWHSPRKHWVYTRHDAETTYAWCPWCGHRGPVGRDGGLL